MAEVPLETRLRHQAERAVREADWTEVARLQTQGLRWAKMLREDPPVRAAAQSPDPDALPRLIREGLVWSAYVERFHAVEPYGEALRTHPVTLALLARFRAWQTLGIHVPAIAPDDRQVGQRNPLHALNAQITTVDPALFSTLWDLLVTAGADPQGRAQPVDAFTDAHALAQRPTAEAVRASQGTASRVGPVGPIRPQTYRPR